MGSPARQIRWAILALAVLSTFASQTLMADIKLGLFPRFPVATMYDAFKPLADRLAKELGEPVQLLVTKDFEQFWLDVQAKKFDVVHLNQYQYLEAHDKFGYSCFAANAEGGEKTMRALLLVRTDSDMHSVADVKGKTVLFGGGPTAMVAYLAPTGLLKKAGLVEGHDYEAKFARNPLNAIIAVAQGVVPVAAAGSTGLRAPEVLQAVDVKSLRVLAQSEPLVGVAWAAAASVSADKVAKIAKLMTTLDPAKAEDADILHAARVDSFFPVTDADFQVARDVAAFVKK